VALDDVKEKMRIIALGGTFEVLHRGHRKLLLKAFQLGDKIIIGLSSDEFAAKKQKKHIGMVNRVQIIPLEDSYGPTINDEKIYGIVTSRETMKTALEINKIRTQRKFLPLRIYVIDFTLAKDGLPISASRILSGTIDKEGKIL
jgi:cytidyltransferase-like protein